MRREAHEIFIYYNYNVIDNFLFLVFPPLETPENGVAIIISLPTTPESETQLSFQGQQLKLNTAQDGK
jgi:hypothetical protein